MKQVIRLNPSRDNTGRFQSESKVWRNRAIVFGAILAFFAWIYIGHWIETGKVNAFYWPITAPNEVYASGPVERDLPGIGPSIEKGQETGQMFRGKASYYSMDGCLGCPPHYDEDGNVYYLTANGDRFDEN